MGTPSPGGVLGTGTPGRILAQAPAAPDSVISEAPHITAAALESANPMDRSASIHFEVQWKGGPGVTPVIEVYRKFLNGSMRRVSRDAVMVRMMPSGAPARTLSIDVSLFRYFGTNLLPATGDTSLDFSPSTLIVVVRSPSQTLRGEYRVRIDSPNRVAVTEEAVILDETGSRPLKPAPLTAHVPTREEAAARRREERRLQKITALLNELARTEQQLNKQMALASRFRLELRGLLQASTASAEVLSGHVVTGWGSSAQRVLVGSGVWDLKKEALESDVNAYGARIVNATARCQKAASAVKTLTAQHSRLAALLKAAEHEVP